MVSNWICQYKVYTINRLFTTATWNPSQAFICTDTHTTISGRRCQYWNSNWPHKPNPKMKNRLSFTDHNFCAIADPTDPRPFCYTTDPRDRWEYCDCQICNRTQSGSECLRWDSHHIKNSLGIKLQKTV